MGQWAVDRAGGWDAAVCTGLVYSPLMAPWFTVPAPVIPHYPVLSIAKNIHSLVGSFQVDIEKIVEALPLAT